MSDNVYTPDKWVIIEITSKTGEVHRRVLGSWYGGFAGSDSWRASSGVEAVEDKGDYWSILNTSGSTYDCFKKCVGMSSYTMGVLANMQKRAADDGGKIEVVDL